MLPLIVSESWLGEFLKTQSKTDLDFWYFGSEELQGLSEKIIFNYQWTENSVENQNELFRLLTLHSLKPKLIILNNFDSMSPGVLAGWLKTLEEPPEQVQFILLTDKPSSLPATILSRCGLYQFQPSDNLANKNSLNNYSSSSLNSSSMHSRLAMVYSENTLVLEPRQASLTAATWQPYNLSRLSVYATADLNLPLID